MRPRYLAIPIAVLMAATGTWLIIGSSRASASASPTTTSPSNGLEPRHPVTPDMTKKADAVTRKKAPDFKLSDQDGKTVSLGDFKGKDLVLFFYPKADTPG